MGISQSRHPSEYEVKVAAVISGLLVGLAAVTVIGLAALSVDPHKPFITAYYNKHTNNKASRAFFSIYRRHILLLHLRIRLQQLLPQRPVEAVNHFNLNALRNPVNNGDGRNEEIIAENGTPRGVVGTGAAEAGQEGSQVPTRMPVRTEKE
ncbi:hypothetical protein BDZ91DRAFT_768070 [Kalaharituber pfeilii]|nr:hypothetical protein BDZ91DRAFT_768070 [Kalaharituber pfeilii]